MTFIFYARNKIRLDELLRAELPRAVFAEQKVVCDWQKSVRDEQKFVCDERICEQQKSSISNSKIRRLILSGSVFVNDMQIRRPAYEVLKGSEVRILFDDEKFFFERQPFDVDFTLSENEVLFEDEFLLLVNKPAFFPVEEAFSGEKKRNNLHDEAVRYLHAKNPGLRNPPYCGLMHRLDRETSGVILFTKQRAVNKAIHDMFENHSFKKIYNALCCPHASFLEVGDAFCVENYIGRISPKGQRAKWGLLSKEKGGLHSKTNFTVLDETMCAADVTDATPMGTPLDGRQKKYLRLQAEPITGRTHQIRVHLSGRNLPILGDTLYGGDEAERMMLHASRLEFCHPVSGELLCVEAPCPF